MRRQVPTSGFRPAAAAFQGCPVASGCKMFDLFSNREILGVWRENYCQDAYLRCARYRLSCDGAFVPLTLLPNGRYLNVDERWLRKVTGS